MNTPIVVQYKINAPAEKVWKALTDKHEMKSWYFNIPDFEPEVGKIFNFYEPGDAKKYHHQCEILEIVPSQILKYSWAYPDFLPLKTVVTWEVFSEHNATVVTLVHEGIESFDNLGEGFSRKSFTEGWNMIIGESLKGYLEN
ncbi:SRPBCC domain-containing protein [Chryseobacterium sp. WG14]|uniref:SRPBCC family protein n=1 Tax=unclassified Chryseobacterium TaxID=2593645 RepID=UPI00211E65EA|nr:MULTISPECIES: SRPBCC domain-containing protein [unclassified Chryseobacterium]MCQ9634092.1 SRPBCC domain-containing protein [Chryseobacterium sp. WG23]MCQ9638154.1 SRPBCC domain-containing protein [Chryseobacterium sp. WG14]